MFHLIPIKQVLSALVFISAGLAYLAMNLGVIGQQSVVQDMGLFLRTSTYLVLSLGILCMFAWRHVAYLQGFIFPYLGGKWEGKIEFSTDKGSETRHVTMTVYHSLLKVTMLLESEESSSRTLATHAERDQMLNRNRVYYVYRNERKEGVPGAGDHYRGLAVLRVEPSNETRLLGDYFTEMRRTGRLELARKEWHPWWRFWE